MDRALTNGIPRSCIGLPWASHIPELIKDLLMNFKLWRTGCTPQILREVKVSYIPKESKVSQGSIAAKGLRPITVLSVWWRAFSSMWLRSDIMEKLHRCMPQLLTLTSKDPSFIFSFHAWWVIVIHDQESLVTMTNQYWPLFTIISTESAMLSHPLLIH